MTPKKSLLNLIELCPSGLFFLYSEQPPLKDIQISGVTGDSRNIEPGWVFVAYVGEGGDGHSYIRAAIEKGAVAILGDKPGPDVQVAPGVPYIQVANGRSVLAWLSAAFSGFPSDGMKVIGVTGTSGKTTTTYLIESVLLAAGYRVGVLGTVNFRFGERVFPSTHTTPGPVELQALLSQMKEEGCQAVVMEVSSHALKQRRVEGISFDAMVFTNLSSEHMDYHPNMEDYFQSKALLFTDYARQSIERGKNPAAVVNQGDVYGARLHQMLLESDIFPATKLFPFSEESEKGKGLTVHLNGIEGQLNGVSIRSDLTGHFNAANIAAAVALGRSLEIFPAQIQKGIGQLTLVPGRLERVYDPAGRHIWVDYAHKPDALEKVLKTLREIKGKNRLITVFGCGGDRDRSKRPVMGKIAVELSDWVWITSDNPRTEDPGAIIDEIVSGVGGKQNFQVEVDRRKAVIRAIQMSSKGDLILIAGKGHEDYQILGKSKIPFDDRKVALEALTQSPL